MNQAVGTGRERLTKFLRKFMMPFLKAPRHGDRSHHAPWFSVRLSYTNGYCLSKNVSKGLPLDAWK